MDDNFSNRGSDFFFKKPTKFGPFQWDKFFKGAERILQISFFKWFRQTIDFQILVSFGGGGSG